MVNPALIWYEITYIFLFPLWEINFERWHGELLAHTSFIVYSFRDHPWTFWVITTDRQKQTSQDQKESHILWWYYSYNYILLRVISLQEQYCYILGWIEVQYEYNSKKLYKSTMRWNDLAAMILMLTQWNNLEVWNETLTLPSHWRIPQRLDSTGWKPHEHQHQRWTPHHTEPWASHPLRLECQNHLCIYLASRSTKIIKVVDTKTTWESKVGILLYDIKWNDPFSPDQAERVLPDVDQTTEGLDRFVGCWGHIWKLRQERDCLSECCIQLFYSWLQNVTRIANECPYLYWSVSKKIEIHILSKQVSFWMWSVKFLPSHKEMAGKIVSWKAMLRRYICSTTIIVFFLSLPKSSDYNIFILEVDLKG